MPPKKADKKAEKGQLKAADKQKQRVIEEKTFGLKNKNKSKAVQKYIKGIHSNVKNHNVSEQLLVEREHQQKEEKKKQQQQAALLAAIFKGTENIKKVDAEKQAKETSPAGLKNQQQINVYIDQREQRKGLKNAAAKDAAAPEKNISRETICKYFVEALERKVRHKVTSVSIACAQQYGWFWECPNGGDSCLYRHCLPEGYILRRDASDDEAAEEDDLSLEDQIDLRRQNLPGEGTKITKEVFDTWKQKSQRTLLFETPEERRRETHRLPATGRDLFALDPALFVDDVGAIENQDYEIQSEDGSRASDDAPREDLSDGELPLSDGERTINMIKCKDVFLQGDPLFRSRKAAVCAAEL